jgi:hypothetical protein
MEEKLTWLRNKKGDVTDGIIFIVIIFFLAVAFIVGAFVNDKFKDIVQSTPLNESTAAQDIIDGLDRITTTGIQRGFVMVFAFLIIAMMMSSFLVRVHPAWLFMYILFLAFAVIITVPMSNAYNTLIEASALADIASQQTMITWIMTNAVKILIGTVCLSIIILFAKPLNGGTVL